VFDVEDAMSSGTTTKRRWRLWRWLVVISWVLAAVVAGGGAAEVTEQELEELRDERRGLLELRDALRSALDLHSNWTGPPCHRARSRWLGVSCDADGHVAGLSLDRAQLTGALPLDALRSASRLSTLSLRGNALRGALPELEGLRRLRSLDLSGNRFSGPIPIAYAVEMPELARIEIQDNLLTGNVPAFTQHGLVVLNVSYNFLRGEVPHALRRFPASAFGHNLGLCGEAVNAACPERPPATDSAPAATAGSGSSDDPGVKPVNGSERAARKHVRFRLATWSVVVILLIAALVPFAAVLILLHHTRNAREVRLGSRAGAAGDTLHCLILTHSLLRFDIPES
jgi:hypothetical protein